jgi:protein TonB
MNARSLSLISIGMILVTAVTVSYLISKPIVSVQERSLPVFMGEEVAVQRAVEGVRSVKTVKKAERVVKSQKVVSQPVPQPKIAAPLPILPPRISYRVLPEYPVTALEQGLAGTVLLSIYVGMGGAAEQVKVKSSSGVAELDAAALQAASQWKFSPASQGGQALASWFELPLRFEVK